MALVQKTIELKVSITVEVEEDLIGTDKVDDPFQLASTVAWALDYFNVSGELFTGGRVTRFSADVIGVEDAIRE